MQKCLELNITSYKDSRIGEPAEINANVGDSIHPSIHHHHREHIDHPMDTFEGHRAQRNSRSLFSESTSSTPSLQSPTPLTTGDVDRPRYVAVDPFHNPRPHHYVSVTIDDIPVFPTPKSLANHHISHANPTLPPHGVNTPPHSPPLRPEVTGCSRSAIRQSSSTASRPTQLFNHAHDSIPLYHAHGASPSRRHTLIEGVKSGCRHWGRHLPALFMEVLPRKCYLYLLLGLPKVYFMRVSRVFKDAGLNMSEIKKMALEYHHRAEDERAYLSPWSPARSYSAYIPFSYRDLQTNWNVLIDMFIKEWTTSVLISCIILCATLLFLQRDIAGSDPVSRYFLLFSSIFCLLGLVYGCIYILRFGVMRDVHKTAEWAFEAQKVRTHLLWNVWIFLSLPAVFSGWSVTLLICSVLSVVWRTSSTDTSTSAPINPSTSSGLRAFITVIFGLGVVYLALVLRMFHRFGDAMDEAWDERVKTWNAEKAQLSRMSDIDFLHSQLATPAIPSLPLSPLAQVNTLPLVSLPAPLEPTLNSNDEQVRSQQKVNTQPSLSRLDLELIRAPSPLAAESATPTLTLGAADLPLTLASKFDSPSESAPRINNYPYLYAPPECKASKVLDMRGPSRPSSSVPKPVVESGISTHDWRKFVTDIFTAWELHGGFGTARPSSPGSSDEEAEDDIGSVLERWNASTFSSVGIQALLCQEFPCGLSDDHSHIFAIYIIECDRTISLAERFGAVPHGLCRIDICDPMIRHLRTSLISSATKARVCSNSSLSLDIADD